MAQQFKVGKKVVANGNPGKIVAIRNEGRGDWIDVDHGDKKKPNVKSYRPASVVAA